MFLWLIVASCGRYESLFSIVIRSLIPFTTFMNRFGRCDVPMKKFDLGLPDRGFLGSFSVLLSALPPSLK
ncbi:hypothetical protein N665_0072s0004 [Sinapis alba]|nr:hypothetical protein N665_0072s0004 [Sinapis alba]